MSIRPSAAAVAVATVMLGSGFEIATAGNRGSSRTIVSVCEDTRAHSAATANSAGKDGFIQRPAETSTAASKDSPSKDAVREGEAVITEFGVKASAITYWVSESDGWHVVTTVAIRLDQDRDSNTTVVRFSAVLLPGQLQRISVPVAVGERQQVLCIRRLGDRLETARVFGPSV
jgi:hypothetical protein